MRVSAQSEVIQKEHVSLHSLCRGSIQFYHHQCCDHRFTYHRAHTINTPCAHMSINIHEWCMCTRLCLQIWIAYTLTHTPRAQVSQLMCVCVGGVGAWPLPIVSLSLLYFHHTAVSPPTRNLSPGLLTMEYGWHEINGRACARERERDCLACIYISQTHIFSFVSIFVFTIVWP